MASFGFGPKASFMVLGTMDEPPAKRRRTEEEDSQDERLGHSAELPCASLSPTFLRYF